MDILDFLIYAVMATYTPGPNPIMSMSNANEYGFKKTLPFILGIGPALVIDMCICIFASKFVFTMLPQVETVMRILGKTYIFYLAIKIYTNTKKIESKPRKLGFWDGFLFQFINPKVFIYGLTAASTYILPHYENNGILFLLAVILAMIPFVGNFLWAGFGSFLKNLFNEHRRVINTIMALLLVYCGIKI